MVVADATGAWRGAKAGLLAALLAGSAACALLAAAPTSAAVIAPPSGTADLAGVEEFGTRVTTGGRSAAFLGDVNGDGVGDIAIGDPNADPKGRPDAGSVFVVYGQRGFAGTVDVAAFGPRGYRIDGRVRDARLGTSVAALGDVDGDPQKLADFAVSAPRARVTGRGPAGVVYVVHGSASRGDTDLGRQEDKGIVRLLGLASGDNTGWSLAALDPPTAGGATGLVIGAPTADPPGRPNAGSVYVLPGPLPSSGSMGLGRLSETMTRIDGPVAGEQFGHAVGAIPDMSGDGLAEVLVGSPRATGWAGRAFVISARQSVEPLVAAASPAVTVIDGAPGMQLGSSILALPNLVGDGLPDIAIGAPTASSASRAAGSVFIVPGVASSPLPIAVAAPPPGTVRLDGASASDGFGRTLAVADLDGDPFSDLLVGAPQADPLARVGAGAVYALRGERIRGGLVDVALLGRAGVRLAGGAARGAAGAAIATGTAIAGGPDAGGDGRPDVLVAGTSETSLVDLPFVPQSPPAFGAPAGNQCAPARDIQLVLDDSSSMRTNDPQQLRRTAIEVMLSKLRSAEIRLGAIDVGPRAAQVFPTLTVGATGLADPRELATLRGLLDESIRLGAGSADFAAGLAAAVRERPQADALVLITDGSERLAGPLPLPGPPVYVLALRARAASATASLFALAQASGGRYFEAADAAALPAALAIVEAGLSCEQPLATKVSTARGGASAAPPPPSGAITRTSQVVAAATVTQKAPQTTFATGLAMDTKTVTTTVTFPQAPPSKTRKKRRFVSCVDRSPVRLRTLRIFARTRVAARATEKQLRAALSGQPRMIGKLRIWGRCGRGYLTLRISGLERVPAAGPGVQAAAPSPTRGTSLSARLGNGRGKRKLSVSAVGSPKKVGNVKRNNRRGAGR